MSWDIKDIVALVQLGVLSVSTAREMLGIEDKKESVKVSSDELNEGISPYQKAPVNSADFQDCICGECAYYLMEEVKCDVTGEQREFDSKACNLFALDGEEPIDESS